jgi:hypothetical protein
MADFVADLHLNQEKKIVFKKMPSIEIPNEIIMSYKVFLSHLDDEKMEKFKKTPEYIDFYKFVSDISNIGLVNDNGQYGYFSEPQLQEHCMNIFEYNYPENYSKESVLNVMSILEQLGYTYSKSRLAIYGCDIEQKEYVWVNRSILVKI